MGNSLEHLSDEQLAAFLDGNVSADEMNTILDSLAADPETAEILSLSPEIDRLAEEDHGFAVLPMTALAAANPDNLCSFECECEILRRLGFNADHWSLLETAKANNWLREEGTPLHHVGRLLELKGLDVRRKYDATLHDVADAVAHGCETIAVIDKNMVDGSDAHHAVLVKTVDDGKVNVYDPDTADTQEIAEDKFLAGWETSGRYMVTAAVTAAGYNPQPIDVENIDLDADLEDLTEAIAENAHDVWARARMDEGWTYGPVRDDKLKTHPDLVPYAKLPDSEKEYDRIMAMNTLRLVRRLGFRILKA